MQFSSIQPIDRALSGATPPGQSGPGINGNKGVLRFPQSSSITGTTPSDCLLSYPGYSLVGSHPSAIGVFYRPSRLGKWMTKLMQNTQEKLFNRLHIRKRSSWES